MKKFILLCILFSCCREENSPNLTTITVVESITNLPVKDATLVLFRCNYGCPLGPDILFTGTTDDNGVCKVPSESYTDAASEINVVKTGYWPFETQKNVKVSITPEGWLQLNIHRTSGYPAGSKLLLNLLNQLGSRSDLTDYNTAADSLIVLRAYGGQLNKIDWQVVDANFDLISNGDLDGMDIPKFDTLKGITLNY